MVLVYVPPIVHDSKARESLNLKLTNVQDRKGTPITVDSVLFELVEKYLEDSVNKTRWKEYVARATLLGGEHNGKRLYFDMAPRELSTNIDVARNQFYGLIGRLFTEEESYLCTRISIGDVYVHPLFRRK